MENPKLDRVVRKVGKTGLYDFNITNVKPLGIVIATDTASEFAVKLYEMFKVGFKRPRKFSKENYYNTVYDKIISGEVDKRSGIGFAILSEEALNISMWGKAKEYSLVQDISRIFSTRFFFYTKDFPNNLKKLNQGASGSYSIYEAEILAHEAKAWKQYLWHSMHARKLAGVAESTKAEKRYLDDFLKGIIDVSSRFE
jgi:hypothetical protein